MNLADRLIAARKDAGITEPADLAHRIGVKPSAIYQIEAGKSKSLKGLTLIKLADELGVHPRWLLLGRGPRESQSLRITPAIIATTQEVLSAYLRITGQALTMARDPELLATTFTLVMAEGGARTEQDSLELAAKLAEAYRARGGQNADRREGTGRNSG